MVTFANGKTLETIAVYGGSMQYQDAQRKTLEIVCAVSALSLDEAKALWTDAAATSEITVAETITNPVTVNTDSGDMTVSEKTETVQSVHVNFTLPVIRRGCTSSLRRSRRWRSRRKSRRMNELGNNAVPAVEELADIRLNAVDVNAEERRIPEHEADSGVLLRSL